MRTVLLAMLGFVLIEILPLTFKQPLQQARFYSPPAALAQPISVTDVWRKVYERIPDFPKENQYVGTETGKPSTNNTLASRLIRYHIFVKGRPPGFRLDWKMTLADYLGVNDLMEDAAYPARDVLQINPLDGDRAAIQRLNRAQRDQLIQVLVELFNPESAKLQNPVPASSPTGQPALQPAPTPTPVIPPKPGRSGADLLK